MGVVVIGLGGIGSALVEPLARYLNYNGGPKELVLIDGDSYERHNLERQRAGTDDLSKNKAKVHSERLKKHFNHLTLAWHEDFVTKDNIGSFIKSGDVVLACVDNHATRKILQEHCQRLRDIILISGGNEFFDGNILIYMKRNSRQLTPPIHKYHPEIAFPEDKSPDQLSCEELEGRGNEQLIFTNLTVAVLMLNAFYSLTQAKARYSEVYFDIRQNSFRAFERR